MCIMKWEVVENCVLVEIHKKTFLWALPFNVIYKIPFILRKICGDTRHPCEKINPPSIVSGGGGAAGQGLLAYRVIVFSNVVS